MSEPWSWQHAYGKYDDLEQETQTPYPAGPPAGPPAGSPAVGAMNPGAPPWAQPQGYGPYGYQQFGGYPPPPAVSQSGLGFLIAACICGGLALLFLPIILGPLGAVFGFVAYSRGNKAGLWAGAGSILTTILGVMIGVWVATSMHLHR